MQSDQWLNDLVETITTKVIRTLYDQGFINLTRMRNEKIKNEFRILRNQNMSVGKAIEKLCDRNYFNRQGQPYRIGPDSIMKIVYKGIKRETN